jgi:soluble lytic murein transglycosylase-like protein
MEMGMQQFSRRAAIGAIAFGLAGCGGRGRRAARREERDSSGSKGASAPLYPNETPALRKLIVKYSNLYDVPIDLVQRLIVRESNHRPGARNGPYYGLMQILPQTAAGMGFRGKPNDLLDAETNLKYAVKYLRGAWLLSDGSYDTAVKWYSQGYYYEAKRRGMLKETGLAS